jgi:DNA-binding SARP family transcriptional activator/tetratricopeptide (TPR) repeat protein
MERLSLLLLGDFQAAIGTHRKSLPLRKAQALLAFLSLAPGRRHSRERLAALLWGDVPDDQARNSLRQTLFAIRAALGAEATLIGADGATVWIEPGAVDVDVLEFERCLAASTDESLTRATSLYRGDLLEGVDVGEPTFDEWLVPTRERLRRAAVKTMTSLLERQLASGARESAMATAARLLSVDPLQEAGHRALIRLYAAEGRRGDAIRQYHTCADLLRRELQTAPEPTTVQLYQQLLPELGTAATRAAPAPNERRPGIERAPFVGRRDELANLVSRLRRAAGGRGGVVAVLGEAGVGKTRLTEELIAQASQVGALVLRGRAYESARALPLALWVEALRDQVQAQLRDLESLGHAWAHDLEALFPGSRRPRARGGDRLRLFEALAQLIRWLAAGHPVLFVLDDLHWADDTSLQLLAFLGRRLGSWAVLVVATARPEELDAARVAALADLARDRRLDQLTLEPLSIQDTNTLARALAAPETDAADLARLLQHAWRMSEGNPFVVIEAMRTARAGPVPADGGAVVPEAVRTMTRSRLRRLSERAQRLVAVAATIGREFDFALLHGAVGSDELDTAEGLEELVRAHVVRERGERFEIAHDRIRDVVAGDLLPARQRALHASVARALETLHGEHPDAHSAELAHHHHAASLWDKAVTYLRLAGAQAASRGAYREAVAFFEQALADLARLPRSRETLELGVDLRFDLRDWLMPLGELIRLEDYVREADELAGKLRDDRRRGLAIGHLSHHCQSTGQQRRAIDLGHRAAEIATRLADPTLIVLANFNLGQAHHHAGEHHAAIEYLRRNVALVSGDGVYERYAGPGPVPLQSRFWLAFSLAELGEYREALQVADDARRAARTVQHPYSEAFAEYAVGRLQLVRGATTEALHALERARELVERREIALMQAQLYAWLGYAWALTGRRAEGIRLIREAADQAAAMRRACRGVIGTRLAEALLADGLLDEALAAARRAIELTRQQQERGHEAAALTALADVLAGVEGVAVETVERAYGEAQDLAQSLHLRPVLAGCHRGLGRYYRRLGKSEAAENHLSTATRLIVEMGLEPVASPAAPGC